MRFDSVRSVKTEIFEEVFDFRSMPVAASADQAVSLFLPRPETDAFDSISRGRNRDKKDARDQIALGILSPDDHNQNPEGFKLGIFIQRRDLRDHPIVQKAQQQARGEVRVIYTGPIKRQARNVDRCRPLLIGSSVGHFRVSAGTIGCLCRHEDGGIGILSNNHILADTNKGVAGDVILQPGRADGGRRTDPESRVATLYSFRAIDFGVGARNLVDCAFATLLNGVPYDATSVGSSPGNHQSRINGPLSELVPKMTVMKLGRTTGLTRGVVLATEVDNLVVAMVLGTGERLARFDGQIVIEGVLGDFSRGGDSGSLVWTEQGNPAALLFAGADRGGTDGRSVTFANPLRRVLDALDIEVAYD